jgi:hypothetical protein
MWLFLLRLVQAGKRLESGWKTAGCFFMPR